VKVTIILDFVDEVGLDYQASKLRHTINAEISTAGSRWEPDSGISAGNFCRKLRAAGSVNELSGWWPCSNAWLTPLTFSKV
jgi:hypothetical protein